ncbi:MAG TPA: AMP-binding protein, partial [Planctomycetota bacterium]|nr:AMP-binding protein [Planctomycetota bacterium]
MDGCPPTLSELLRRRARERPDQEALVYPAFAHGGAAVRLTYAQLDARADELAAGLIVLGLEKGEHVALWAANVPDWVPLQFALARIGAVLVTVNTALARDELAFVLRQSRAVAVLHTTRTGSNEASRSLDELLLADDPAVARLRHRVWLPTHPHDEPAMGVGPGHGVGALHSLHALAERGRSLAPEALAAREAACRPDDVVNIQYTSGTTGTSKGVMLSHANVLGSGATLGALLGTTPADRVAMVVPLFHCFGCVVCVLGAYIHGATLCCIPAFDPGDALRLVDEEKCTLLHGVPT